MILLDTHALIWLLYEPEKLGSRARGRIVDSPRVYVSAVSHVEIRIKQALGKIRIPADFDEDLVRFGLAPLPMTDRHATVITDFPDLVGHDPFDRQILAQAAAEGLDLFTADRRLLSLDQEWIVDVRD